MIQSRNDDAFDDEEISGEGSSISDRRAARRKRRERQASKQERSEKRETATDSEGKGRATMTQAEAQRARDREALSASERLPVVGGAVTYLKGVASEIQKVTWPTREEAQRLTIIVIIFTVIASAFLGLIDFLLGLWFREAIEHPVTFVAIGAIGAVVVTLVWFGLQRLQDDAI